MKDYWRIIASRVAGMALASALMCQTAHAFTTVAAANAGVGIAVDSSSNTAYFVEFNAGTLKRIHLTTPACSTTTVPCVIDTVASGFSHPEDVALDVAHGLAYVTTRDGLGTTGALWRVNLTTGALALVTFNLEAPQQIALDVPTNTAYVVGFDSGRLWKVDLTTGSKTTVVAGLGHPVGLVINGDRTRAYITEQTPAGRLSVIDLALHVRAGDLATGLSAPFFLSWTDPGQAALYVVERAPSGVRRIDLPTSASSPVIGSGLSPLASGIAVDWVRSTAYITANTSVVSADLGALPMLPIFLGVGHVPFSDISADGYATTSTPQISAKDAPFGGTLDIFGNLDNFKTTFHATHYRVLVSRDGGLPAPVMVGWTTERFNPSPPGKYEPATISPSAVAAPYAGNTLYQIPPEYPSAPWRWKPPYQMLRWVSGANGLYTFTVELFQQSGSAFTAIPIPLPNQLALRIDNDAPDVDLLQVYQHAPLTAVPSCAIVQTPLVAGPSKFDVAIKAYDVDGHLLSYAVKAYWGHNQSGGVMSDNYSAHVSPTRQWNGVTNFRGPSAGWDATCNCAYTFFVGAWKRTINGYWLISYREAHQSITIDNINPITTFCP